VVARFLALTLLLFPVVVSLGVTLAVRILVPPPAGGLGRIGWWAALLFLAIVVTFCVERLARRGMPLVALLKMAMLFPDRAPTRFAVARKAGSLRQLRVLAAQLDVETSPESHSASESATTILALVTALSAHDRHTRGHAERVRTFTDMLGEELRLPEDDRYRLRWAALLHDIGKLTVRAGILNKPSKLDDEEWTTMRGHPAEGARIATPLMAWLGPWGRAIPDHHERFDGTGYPDGLAGDAISTGGRIVAVADAYDTMTSARTYKRPIATRAAREELAGCAGGQFDPEFVRAFLSISLPRLVWATGPVSFLVHLPFLARLQEAGQLALMTATQAATVAGAVAAITAVSVTGSAAAKPSSSQVPSRGAVSAATTATSAPGSGGREAGGVGHAGGGGGGSHPGGGGGPAPAPSPSPSPPPESPPGSLPISLPTSLPLPLPTTLPIKLPISLPLPLPTELPLHLARVLSDEEADGA
jgi:hypothetical protein